MSDIFPFQLSQLGFQANFETVRDELLGLKEGVRRHSSYWIVGLSTTVIAVCGLQGGFQPYRSPVWCSHAKADDGIGGVLAAVYLLQLLTGACAGES